ncbi:CvfB family protein [Paenibacillus eucommiae]|uniref:RNA-binding protein (Virulence factor B family) n=1 Tax=Paenibacillus eucommiae TaxID=1355755 RepID=A0ABS4IZ81_9BACL|nr:S1-like domain-containing RNA-binding protein [Paenibacillus eucommiae]MBP1992897.1 putative RNA-binding protein (virulence factor B family) [Paenibacillus eucommiae]
MSMEAGALVSLKIAREVSPNGFFLTDGKQDVLLPYGEVVNTVQPGDKVEVFLYFDTQDRLVATMKCPLLVLGEVGLLEVVDVHPRFGYFLEMGLGRHLLLPYKHVPELEELRPKVGDHIFVYLTHDRQGRLIAKLAGEEELAPLCVRAPSSWKNLWLEARVYKPLQIGTFVVCDAGVLGFGVIGLIAASERTSLLRVGERVKVRVTFVREDDGRVNLSMRPFKEQGRDEDSERILKFLQERPGGAMPYSDQTPADVIASRFSMSKAAFKRALGKLMKEGLIVQKENWSYLKREEESAQEASPNNSQDNSLKTSPEASEGNSGEAQQDDLKGASQEAPKQES